jgi:hypothetical protein
MEADYEAQILHRLVPFWTLTVVQLVTPMERGDPMLRAQACR